MFNDDLYSLLHSFNELKIDGKEVKDDNEDNETEDYTSPQEDADEESQDINIDDDLDDNIDDIEDYTIDPENTDDTDQNPSKGASDIPEGADQSAKGNPQPQEEEQPVGDISVEDTGNTDVNTDDDFGDDDIDDFTIDNMNDADAGMDDENVDGENPDETQQDPNDEPMPEENPQDQPADQGLEDDNSLKSKEKDLFADLTPQQIAIKNGELLQNFIDLYDDVVSIADNVNKIPKTYLNTRPIEFVADKLVELKDITNMVITTTYVTKTYVENLVIYKQCLLMLQQINTMLKAIVQKPSK